MKENKDKSITLTKDELVDLVKESVGAIMQTQEAAKPQIVKIPVETMPASQAPTGADGLHYAMGQYFTQGANLVWDKLSPLRGTFIGTEIKEDCNFGESFNVYGFGSTGMYTFDPYNHKIESYTPDYPMIVGDYKGPLGVFVPFNMSLEGYQVTDMLFNNFMDNINRHIPIGDSDSSDDDE